MAEDFQDKARRLRDIGHDSVRFQFDNVQIEAGRTDSVAAALIGAGIKSFRTTVVKAKPRGPYCMMGVCFDCLVEIDGLPNQQACMTIVRPGMQVKSMKGARPSAATVAAHADAGPREDTD